MGPALERFIAVAADLDNGRGATRREILQLAFSSGALALVGCKSTSRHTQSNSSPPPILLHTGPRPPAGKVLSADEWRTYEAAVARILPSEGGIGAREANVIGYIDGQLGTRLFQPALPVFRNGALLLDKWAQRGHGRPFAAVDDSAADAILDELGRGAIPVKSFPQKELFAALHELTLEGFLADPIHGGNEGMVGWKAIDFREPMRRAPGVIEPHHSHLGGTHGDGGAK